MIVLLRERIEMQYRGMGRGTRKMAEMTVAAGLPPPETEDAGGCVTVRFRRNRARRTADVEATATGAGGLTEQQRTVLAIPNQADGALALRDVHARVQPQVGRRQVREVLASLKARGSVALNGRGRRARWKRS